MSNNKDPEIRYCKKCGCELVSTNKHKLCDNCRRETSLDKGTQRKTTENELPSLTQCTA